MILRFHNRACRPGSPRTAMVRAVRTVLPGRPDCASGRLSLFGLSADSGGGLAGINFGLAVVLEVDGVGHVVLRGGCLLDGGDDELQA